MQRLTLTADAVRPASRGHPWVYPDGLRETALPPAGTPVHLFDAGGHPVAFGLTDEGDIAVRVLGRHPEPVEGLLASRIGRAAAERPGLLPADTDAFRLVNGAGDSLPGLVVDRYGGLFVVQVHGRCWEPHLAAVTRAIEALPEATCVVRRLGIRRVDNRQGIDVLAGPEPPESLVVHEAGLRFLVRPRTGQKTGLFLDQREHRRTVASMAAGRTVANLFGYTGGFSVHAAAAGARRVVTVDVAGDALADAQENFRLNGLDPARHGFVQADAFTWRPDCAPDLVICDPPSLSHNKDADRSAARAYRDLATATGAMLSAGGLLATASCTARLSWERWEEAVRDGLRKAGRWSWLWRAAEPPDHPVALAHPEGRYLKFGVLRRH